MATYMVWSETRLLIAGMYSTGLRYLDGGRLRITPLGIVEIPGEEEVVEIGSRRSMISWDRRDKVERIYAKRARVLEVESLKDMLGDLTVHDTREMVDLLGRLDSEPE